MNYLKLKLNAGLPLFLFGMTLIFFSCSKMNNEQLEDEKLPSLEIGLEAHWELEGDATDSGPNNYHGILTGTTPTKDRFGDGDGALMFDGTKDYINVGNISELGFGGVQKYTMAAWVKSQPSGGTIFSKWNFDVMAGWFLTVKDNMTVSSYRHINPWGTTTDETITSNDWQHLMIEFDGTDLNIYINGNLSKSKPYPAHYHDDKTDILFGALHNNNNVTGYFNGVIDDIRIWSRTLTAEEIDFLVKH